MNPMKLSQIIPSLLMISVHLLCATAVKEDKHFWKIIGEQEIELSLQSRDIKGDAKNVILFVGDGMGITTVSAARIYKGQLKNETGEEGFLSFDRFPNLALLKTYNVDRQVPDSAGTATAYLTGVKGNFATVGVDANVKFCDCSTYSKEHDTTSFLAEAAAQGKSVGFVTNTRVTHASPASIYAHSPARKWECDADKSKCKEDAPPNDTSKCMDIAQQLINNGMFLQVIMGGARAKFLGKNSTHPKFPTLKGQRTDGRNLINEWKQKHQGLGHRAVNVNTATELRNVDLNKVDYILGLFNEDHMVYEYDRVARKVDEPSLDEMVTAAIQVLKRNPKGFVLFVEGGKIDSAHHINKAGVALSEAVMFDKAVETAVTATDENDTLIMVTADHSQTFTFGGSSSRGNNILGKGDKKGKNYLGLDGKPMTVLLYASGPSGLLPGKEREDITNNDTTQVGSTYQSLIPVKKGLHGGEDVAVFARGPWSHLFQRVHEQIMVAQVARYAACLPPYETRCERI